MGAGVGAGNQMSERNEVIIRWQEGNQKALNLIMGAFRLFDNEGVLDDISVLGQLGNHVIDLVDFVAASVVPPADSEQLSHWNQLIALSRATGMEITKMASETFDMTPVGVLSQQIGSEVRTLTSLLRSAYEGRETVGEG